MVWSKRSESGRNLKGLMRNKWASRNDHETNKILHGRESAIKVGYQKGGRNLKGLMHKKWASRNAYESDIVLRWRLGEMENVIKMVLIIWMDSYITSKRQETLTWQKTVARKTNRKWWNEMKWWHNLKGLVYQNGARSSPHPRLPSPSPSKAAYTSDQLVLLLSLSYKCERCTVRLSKWHPSVLQTFELCSTCGVVLQIVLS